MTEDSSGPRSAGDGLDLVLAISLRPDLDDLPKDDRFAELDGSAVYGAVRAALEPLGKLRVWDTATMRPAEIASQTRPGLVFNIAEGLRGTAREAQLPALLEWMGWHYVGSDPVTLALALDKAHTNAVLTAAGVPTPPGRLIHSPSEAESGDLRFPLLAKPVAEGSGKGILNSAVLESEAQLRDRCTFLLETYRQPVLLEEVLPGREFTVALLGNRGTWETLPVVEVFVRPLTEAIQRFHLYGFDAKYELPTAEDLVCPAELEPAMHHRIVQTAVQACDALRVRDWARIDLRLDREGMPRVLDVNPLPGLYPGGESYISSFTVAAYADGMTFASLIRRLIETALRRYASPTFLSYDVLGDLGAAPGGA